MLDVTYQKFGRAKNQLSINMLLEQKELIVKTLKLKLQNQAHNLPLSFS
jgi:hypothetical protein